jgi:hypothetical protein
MSGEFKSPAKESCRIVPANAWYEFTGREVTKFRCVTAPLCQHESDGPEQVLMTGEELDKAMAERWAIIVYTYPTCRLQLLGVQGFMDKPFKAVWVKRLVVNGIGYNDQHVGQEQYLERAYWGSFSKVEYHRLVSNYSQLVAMHINSDD